MAFTIGIDLCDDHTSIFSSDGELKTASTVICRDKDKEKWYIGEEAYRMALSGRGVITDKLISLLKKDGRSTIGGKAYSAKELCSAFLEKLLREIVGEGSFESIDKLAISLHSPERELMDGVREAVSGLGIKRDRLEVMSHSESFIYYMLEKDKDLYNNIAAAFDLSEESFSYYEFRILRGLKKKTVICEGTDLEEAFHIDVLETASGQKLADHIIAECAKKLMSKKIFSSVFLTGKGFEDTEWATEFKGFVCKRRRVIYEEGIFARGACIAAEKIFEGTDRDVLMICDTRLAFEFLMDIEVEGRKNKLILAAAGTPWYDHTAHVEFIPEKQDHVEIDIEPIDRFGKSVKRELSFKDFPKRPDRCTRIAMDLSFKSARSFELKLTDLGFGEFFPASGREVAAEMDF